MSSVFSIKVGKNTGFFHTNIESEVFIMKTVYDEKTGIHYCIPDNVDECLFSIWALGCDYDGYNDPDNLKALIDEIVALSQKARGFLRDGCLFPEQTERKADIKIISEDCKSCICKQCALNQYNTIISADVEKGCSPCDNCRTMGRKIIIEDECPFYMDGEVINEHVV